MIDIGERMVIRHIVVLIARGLFMVMMVIVIMV